MKTAIALTLAAVVLAGCSASGAITKRPEIAVAGHASHDPVVGGDGSTTIDGAVDQGAPQGMAAGTSPINPDKQIAFCQDQVAFMFKTEPQYVTTRERIVAADGSTTIDVTVDKGNAGVKTYKCRLDAGNRFIDVIASTSEGAL
jgi:ABC-type phosphate transport system substrate-binding protein